MSYLDLDGFKELSTIPPEFVDEVEARQPGFVLRHLEANSALIDARLRKRYAAPFAHPYPIAVELWLARVTTIPVWMRRGVDPNDEQFVEAKEDATAAWAEIKEAADSNEGLYDLPLRADTSASGISRGGPWGYSEQSPYVWADEQAAIGRCEDAHGRGTGG